MLRWLCALVVAGVVSGFAVLLLAGEYANDGPVLVALSRGHGVHAGDLFVVAGWAVALLALLTLTVMSPGRAGRESAGN